MINLLNIIVLNFVLYFLLFNFSYFFLCLQFKRGRGQEAGGGGWLVEWGFTPCRHLSGAGGSGEDSDSDMSGGSASQHNRQSERAATTPVGGSSTKSRVKQVRSSESDTPSIQLVADSSKFQSQILDIVQSIRPTMDAERQGIMDYTAGVASKLNEDEWCEFSESLLPIVSQFARR